MLFTQKLLLSVSILTYRQESCAQSSTNIPEVNIVDAQGGNQWEKDWEIWGFGRDYKHLVAKGNHSLSLRLLCIAPYKVEWLNINSDDHEFSIGNKGNEIQKCEQSPRMKNGTLIYTSTISISFTSNITSGLVRIKCEHKTKLISSTFNIFIPRKKALINGGETLKYSDERDYIDCPTSNPRIPVTLWVQNSEDESMTEVKNVTYLPQLGFWLKNKQGIYICSTPDNDTVRFEPQKVTQQPPRVDTTQQVQDTTFVIKLKDIWSHCGQMDYTTVFVKQGTVRNQNENRITIYEENGIQFWIYKETANVINLNVNTTMKISKTHFPIVDIFCIQDDSRQNGENKRGKVQSKWSVNRKTQDESNEIRRLEESYYFESDESTPSGRVTWEHFGVDEEIFTVSDPRNTMYANETSNFTCKTASKYANLTFWMEFLNGTKFVLRNGTTSFFPSSSTTVSEPDPLSPSLVNQEVDERDFLNFKTWKLSIKLPLEAVAIICEIPYSSHPTLYLSAEKRFRTSYLSPPKIVKNGMTSSHLKFMVGESHHRIICECSGEPQPKYAWEKDNQRLTETQDVRPTMDYKGNGILEFSSITKSHEGTYKCIATNRIDSDSFTFKVTAQDPTETDDLTKLMTTISVTVVLLFAALICVFGLYRYYSAKALMRGLSEQEIQEFFAGRPELAQGLEDQAFAGNFDVLPYNKTFEIDEGDMILDYKSILGTGEFAIVIKGVRKSNEMQVAVKVAKTTADITVFKSLLSEVKILSYIGPHVNVAGLVGVNTANIQNRNLYIYMDLCELGSLEKYLRSHKKHFVNLIDENKKINRRSLQIESTDKSFSTLDLIRWSAEIASGMEFLSYKSIIHADLAARNILLTRDKMARVSDFGMSKKLYESSLYVKKTKSPLPWRWMALESLKTLVFSTESDVWSYGVTVWEIFTLGDLPFPNEAWNDNFVDMLICGIRMGKPKFSTSQIYSTTVECWDEDPSKRPIFSTLRKCFCDMYEFLS